MIGRLEKYRMAMLALVLLAVGAWSMGFAHAQDAESQAESRHAQAKDWERYRVLVDRNIFSQKRKPAPRPEQVEAERQRQEETKRGENPSESKVRIIADRDAGFVLCGVAIQDGEPVAFVEDRKGGRTLRVTNGQSVGSGKFTAITLSGVAYEVEGMVRELKLGQALTGDVAAKAPATQAATAGNGSGRTNGDGSSGSGNSAELSVLERMQQARQRELGR